MSKYQLLMHVKDILLLFEGKPKLMGYYQTLQIKASTPNEAELKAVDKIRNDDEIKSIWIKDKQKKPPHIFADEIYEVEEFDSDITGNKTGRTFYNAKQWWQFWK